MNFRHLVGNGYNPSKVFSLFRYDLVDWLLREDIDAFVYLLSGPQNNDLKIIQYIFLAKIMLFLRTCFAGQTHLDRGSNN